MRLILAVLLLGACFNRAADHCPGCTLASRKLAPPLASSNVRVVLVGGGFGFGDEWRPVVAALKAARVDFYVYAWPFASPPLQARGLVRALQADLDGAPRLRRIVILAHSAGAMLSAWAVRQLRVPPGRSIFLAAIAGPQQMNFSPYVPDEQVNTPLGLAVGGSQRPIPPVPPGVTIVQYRTEDPPPSPAPPNVHDIYLGRAMGHDASVAAAALPIVRSLAGKR